MIMLRSRPQSLALSAGTISSSAERKSSSSMPYFSLRMDKIPAFTASFSFSLSPSSSGTAGRLPTKTSRASPSMTTRAFFSICSPAKWIKRSDTNTTGSSSFSPMHTSTTVPSFFATTPWMASGMVTHWYFFTPP